MSSANTYALLDKIKSPLVTPDRRVIELAIKLLGIPSKANVFCPTAVNAVDSIEYMTGMNMMVSAVSESKNLFDDYRERFPRNFDGTVAENHTLIKPKDDYHFAFAAPSFDFDFTEESERDQIKPCMIRDKLEIYRSSSGKELRESESHLMALEQIRLATWEGTFFGAVLPKRWSGRNTKFARWWHENAAAVARIKLPESAVVYHLPVQEPRLHYRSLRGAGDRRKFEYGIETGQDWARYVDTHRALCPPGDWCLFIWMRPRPEAEQEKVDLMTYAGYRHSLFSFTLDDFTEESVTECHEYFTRSDWYAQAVSLWQNNLDEHEHRHGKMGRTNWDAFPLPDPNDIYFLDIGKKESPEPVVVPQAEGYLYNTVENVRTPLPNMRRAVQIKPTISRTKLEGLTYVAKAGMLELRLEDGVTVEPKTGEYIINFDAMIGRRHLSDVYERVIRRVYEFGLLPVITEADKQKLAKQARWISQQMTPMERVAPVRVHYEKDEETGEEIRKYDWEVVYDDIGMQACYPEVLAMWRQRAKKMRMHDFIVNGKTITVDFQFDDIIYHASKDCTLNGNTMGLGKTRETLLLCLLRGFRRNLIICPSRLVGEWQDEIQNVILPYVSAIRRNWKGELLDADVKIIEHAADLKDLRTFNIISIDKLKSIPRDCRFFRCPKCHTVSFSQSNELMMVCPGDPSKPEELRCSHVIKNWENKVKRGRKIPVPDGEGGTKLKMVPYRKYKRHIDTGKRVHWETNRMLDPDIPEERREAEAIIIPESDIEIVDERVEFCGPRPKVQRMEPMDTMFEKMTRHRVITTNANGERKEEVISKPRKGHVGWMFADMMKYMFNNVIMDEALHIANADSMRHKAIAHMKARSRRLLTGTPMKGKPQEILPMLNWCFKRAVYPDYRPQDPGSMNKFLRKFGLYVFVGDKGLRKQIPKVNNPELFQVELSPLMLRHVRNEPEVSRVFPRNEIRTHENMIDMDAEHKDYYNRWLKVFADWWQKMKEEEEDRSVKKGELLVKLSYLANASIMPHTMLKNIMKGDDKEGKQWAKLIGPYKGPVVAKQKAVRHMIANNIRNMEKTIVFAARTDPLKGGQAWCDRKGITAMTIHGGVSLNIKKGTNRSKRHEMVQDFRQDISKRWWVMWAGLEVLSEGLNIPEANRGIITDYGWRPDKIKQAIGRMDRPQQTKKIHAHYVVHRGTIDEYMMLYCQLKGRSADEAIDFVEFDDFSVEMIPDVQQYANSIVDGTEEIGRQRMWMALEHLKKKQEQGEEE